MACMLGTQLQVLSTMPQVFQVLKCYKCSIFQVHQTKKDNKWKCKVCGEKQSVKRHYGIGTAKDCRIHVQKLNSMQGNIEESKWKAIDSEDSDNGEEETTKTVDKIKINNTQVKMDNVSIQSKWAAYVEKEDIPVVNESEYVENIEVCLEFPRKRKINRKNDTFKVPKLTNKSNKTTEIFNSLTSFNSDEDKLKSFNYYQDNSNDLSYGKSINQLVSHSKKIKAIDESSFFQTNENSKWAQYVENENVETDNHYGVTENVENHIKENIDYCDDQIAQNGGNNYHQDKDENYCCQQHIMNVTESRHLSKVMENESNLKPVTSKTIFSLCDDNDLDNILDF